MCGKVQRHWLVMVPRGAIPGILPTRPKGCDGAARVWLRWRSRFRVRTWFDCCFVRIVFDAPQQAGTSVFHKPFAKVCSSTSMIKHFTTHTKHSQWNMSQAVMSQWNINVLVFLKPGPRCCTPLTNFSSCIPSHEMSWLNSPPKLTKMLSIGRTASMHLATR